MPHAVVTALVLSDATRKRQPTTSAATTLSSNHPSSNRVRGSSSVRQWHRQCATVALRDLQPKYCNHVLGVSRANFTDLSFLGHLLSFTEAVQETADPVHLLFDSNPPYRIELSERRRIVLARLDSCAMVVTPTAVIWQ